MSNMTRTETITRLCELVAEIEEARANTKSTWWVHDSLQEVAAKVQGILNGIQNEMNVKNESCNVAT